MFVYNDMMHIMAEVVSMFVFHRGDEDSNPCRARKFHTAVIVYCFVAWTYLPYYCTANNLYSNGSMSSFQFKRVCARMCVRVRVRARIVCSPALIKDSALKGAISTAKLRFQ